ncbi:MAG: hypothetical protein U9N44_05280, partial [Chloroflexota bacterium]|nr:hypothetical protein [Chloroflexota bacterium]
MKIFSFALTALPIALLFLCSACGSDHSDLATPTPEVTPTPSAQILFSDDFSDPSSSWDTFADSTGTAFYEQEWLHIRENEGGSNAKISYAHQSLTDFVLEVDTTLIYGPDSTWHVIECRSNRLYQSYRVEIATNGYYKVTRVNHNTLTALKGPTTSTYINTEAGAINHVRIEFTGSKLILSINGHKVCEVNDSVFASGDIGLGIDSAGQSLYTEGAYDNV